MNVKGVAVKSIQDFVRSKFSEQYDEWVNALPELSKKIMLNPVHDSEWYPVHDAIVEPTIVIGNLFFEGDVNKAGMEGGRFTAEISLTGMFKIFVKISSPTSIIERACKILPTFYDSSDIVVKEMGLTHVTFSITGLPFSNPVVESRIVGWIQKVFESTRHKNLRISIPQSLVNGAPETIMKIEWD